MKHRIAVVTGTRAEYGLLRSTLFALQADPRVELHVLATGMHLLRRTGYTVREIVADGFQLSGRVRMQTGRDTQTDQAEGLGRGVTHLARCLNECQADIVLVLGDRIEALAGALAAVTTGRVLAHVHGGDVAPGDFDDSIRHSITKLAHVHLPATPQAAKRVQRMGEQPERIHVVGAPGLDELAERMTQAEPRTAVGRDVLVIQHAYGRAAQRERKAAWNVFRAVCAEGLRPTIIHPNTDRGSCGAVQAIEDIQRAAPRTVQVVRSLPRAAFLDRLIHARLLIGNSSCGIIEAPFAGTPSVNVGTRQLGRQPGGRSIVHVDETQRSIRDGIQAALRMRPRSGQSVYGDGNAGQRIAAILRQLPLEDGLRQKRLAYS